MTHRRWGARPATAAAVGALVALGIGAAVAIPGAMANANERTLTAPTALDGFSIETSAPGAVVGDEVTVTVKATAAADLYAYDLTLAYDSHLLKYVDDSATTDVSGATYATDHGGTLSIIHTKLGSSPAADGVVTLASVTFTGLASGDSMVEATDLVAVTSADSASTESTTTTDLASAPLSIGKLPAPVATSPARIAATARVGSVLTAKVPTWDQDGVATEYQWLVGGSAVARATSASYRPTVADYGKAVSVVVSGTKSDHVTGQSTSASVKVGKAVTSTSLVAGKKVVKAGKQVRVRVKVSATGAVPTGKVVVTLAGKRLHPAVTLKGGTATFTVTVKGKKGARHLVVAYSPSSAFTASTDSVKIRLK
ncbi:MULTISPECIES: cohesin domain-containing protein [unclassified Nocardioides]|uniref:cohesin domain-containing protein n=1 Tax=unclassified Nocardioides TaxID=2615069 RepID=UPI00138F18BF|nr:MULTISPECIES: Ig-like domain repeat protein [unclassified Nocardioides]